MSFSASIFAAASLSSSGSSGSPIIHLTTLENISGGAFTSAVYQRGQKDIFGNAIQTKTLGLNGTMVEVENLKVQVVGGPAYDMDYHIEVTDGVISDFITEVPKFPQVSTASYLLTPLPTVGETINIVGTVFRDGAHWEVHPIFAWQPASEGPINDVCAPAGTVSPMEQLCFSLNSSSSSSSLSSNSVETTITTSSLMSTSTATTAASVTSSLNESASSSSQSAYSSTSSSLILQASTSSNASTTSSVLSSHSTMISVKFNAMSESDNSSSSTTPSTATFLSPSSRLVEISGIVGALISTGLLGMHVLRRKR